MLCFFYGTNIARLIKVDAPKAMGCTCTTPVCLPRNMHGFFFLGCSTIDQETSYCISANKILNQSLLMVYLLILIGT
jgi:hypothetical protein